MEEFRSRGQLRTGFKRSEMLKVQKEIERIKNTSTCLAEHKKAISKAVESTEKEGRRYWVKLYIICIKLQLNRAQLKSGHVNYPL